MDREIAWRSSTSRGALPGEEEIASLAWLSLSLHGRRTVLNRSITSTVLRPEQLLLPTSRTRKPTRTPCASAAQPASTVLTATSPSLGRCIIVMPNCTPGCRVAKRTASAGAGKFTSMSMSTFGSGIFLDGEVERADSLQARRLHGRCVSLQHVHVCSPYAFGWPNFTLHGRAAVLNKSITSKVFRPAQLWPPTSRTTKPTFTPCTSAEQPGSTDLTATAPSPGRSVNVMPIRPPTSKVVSK